MEKSQKVRMRSKGIKNSKQESEFFSKGRT